MILLVDPRTDGHAEQPAVGQRLGPERIHFTHRIPHTEISAHAKENLHTFGHLWNKQ
jgi:hypothetical protein